MIMQRDGLSFILIILSKVSRLFHFIMGLEQCNHNEIPGFYLHNEICEQKIPIQK